jgi:hypothetical protein
MVLHTPNNKDIFTNFFVFALKRNAVTKLKTYTRIMIRKTNRPLLWYKTTQSNVGNVFSHSTHIFEAKCRLASQVPSS